MRSEVNVLKLGLLLRAAFRRLIRQLRPRQAAATVAPSPRTRHVYLFFDEAGDLDFGNRGSRHFITGILVVRDPWVMMDALNQARRELFSGALIPERFHAAEDKQAVRDRVLAVITAVGDFDAYMVVSDKARVPQSYRDSAKFYTFSADLALRSVLQRYPTDEPIYVITDSLPVQRKREAVVKGFKASLVATVGSRRFEIAHQSSASQGFLQVADYVTWAVFRKWERGDERSFKPSSALLRMNCCSTGHWSPKRKTPLAILERKSPVGPYYQGGTFFLKPLVPTARILRDRRQ